MLESWRLPFGQSGLLALFLRIQATEGVDDRILIPCLKFIGNTCADTGSYHNLRGERILTLVIDLNREVAISPEYLPSLIRHVVNPRISRTIVPVVYNTCNDYGGSRP